MPLFRGSTLFAVVLLLALAPVAARAAEPSSAPLQPEQSGRLTGDRGGAFAHYRFTYPSGGPRSDPRATGPPGQRPRGRPAAVRSAREVGDQAASEPGDYLVQIYNYEPGLIAEYSLVARGLPAQPPPPPRPPPAASRSGRTAGPAGAARVATGRG